MLKYISRHKNGLAAVNHVIVMFVSVITVPKLIGLDPSLALITAGIATLVFYYITSKKVPIFLGSSFTFIGVMIYIKENFGIGAVKSGVMVVGLVYIVISLLIKLYGTEKIRSFFPSIVTSPLMIVMGLKLSKWAIQMMTTSLIDGKIMPADYSFSHGIVGATVVFTLILILTFSKGVLSLLSIMLSLVIGITTSLFLLGKYNMSQVSEASWIGFSHESLEYLIIKPAFNLEVALIVIPITLFIIFEHITDLAVVNSVTQKDIYLDPGLDRTLLGNGVGIFIAGFLGGPVNTTYSENVSTLEISKVKSSKGLFYAAIATIILAFFGKFTALIGSIPTYVTGAISLVLYAFLTSYGVRTLIFDRVDFQYKRNMIICATILVFGMMVNEIHIYHTLAIPGLPIATIIGILLNKFLPEFK